MNTQDWSPLGLTGWNSLESKVLSRVFSNTTVQKHQFFGPQLPFVFEYGVIEKKKILLLYPSHGDSMNESHEPQRLFLFQASSRANAS